MNRVILDVKDILGDVGAEKSYSFERDFNPIISETTKLAFSKPVNFDIIIENTGRGVRVKGRISSAVFLECSRCLNEFEFPVEWEIDEVFVTETMPGEDVYTIDETRIDLGPPAEEAFVLAVPMKPLCHDACAGLCPVCGEPLDEHHRAHEEEKVDARMEALRQLLEDKGGESARKA
ncbi:MAG: DUF177 domain-containing protein [Actinomycetota bacterium]|nr:DUF177 domain-containing protein [Actinomycetota bacterium]